VRFVPDAGWIGTVINGISFHGWDQTSGAVGGTADINSTYTVRDEFNAASFGGNDGTVNWAGAWQELDEVDGPTAGKVEAGGSPAALKIGGNNHDINGIGASREADLTGAISATLSFEYWEDFDEVEQAGAGVHLDISEDGGSTWTTLQNYVLDGNLPGSSTPASFDISAYISGNTQIRFIGTGNVDGYFNADNVQIEYTTLEKVGGDTAFSLASASSRISVVPNQAPSTTNSTVALSQDDTYVLTAADFNYSDPEGDSFTQVKIVTLETAGALKLNGSDVTAGQVVSVTDINSGLLTFTPGAGESGSPYATFTYQVHDGSQYSDSVSTTTLIDTGFDADADGFTYADDSFGTSNPGNATGTYEAAGGQSGGGLRVFLGPGDIVNPASGGWSQSFNLAADAVVSVALDFRMLFDAEHEVNEFGEVILDIDGTRYGNDTNNSLVHINGNGPGGSDDDTGWLSGQFEIALTAGSHTLTIGLYNNDSTWNNEWAEAFFDNVQIGLPVYNTMTFDVNAAPVLDTNAVLILDEGATATVTNTLLQVTDADNGADEIV
jgi:hypothetical protein